jgi:hypothetical protein
VIRSSTVPNNGWWSFGQKTGQHPIWNNIQSTVSFNIS